MAPEKSRLEDGSTVSQIMWRHGAVLVFIPLYFAAGLFGLSELHYWGGDFAHYIFQARAIVENGALTDPDFVRNPHLGPAIVPPVFSLMLVPFYAAYGFDLQWLKVPGFASLCLGLAFIYLLLHKIHSRGLALAAVIVFALMPFVWGFRQQILTEFSFILFSFAALYFNQQRRTGKLGPDIVYSIVTGLLLFVAFMTRQIGLILFVAVLLSDGFRINNRRCLVASAIAFLASASLIFDPVYYPEVETFCLYCIEHNLIRYYVPITALF